MLDPKIEELLKEIFGAKSGWLGGEFNRLKMCPGFDDITAFAPLINRGVGEEELQIFIEEHPQFLFGLFGAGDESDLAFITKPRVGKMNADFAILNYGQGGCTISLIEIERASCDLFNKGNTFTHDLQKAMSQVYSWSEWIEKNQNTFVRDTLDDAMKLPLYPEKHKNKSFKLEDADKIEGVWKNFGGFDYPVIKYAIVIGRWSKLSKDHQQKLIHLNTKEGYLKSVYTFEQLIRTAYTRPQRLP